MNAATLRAQEARMQLGDLPEALRAVDALTMAELQAKFAEVFGHSTASRNRTYLQRKIKYRVQELALGGLTDRARARAELLAEDGRVRHTGIGATGDSAPDPARVVTPTGPEPGTTLRRSFQGTEHEVRVLEEGRFHWNGREFTSLSTIAKAITGTNWNGHVFFGLKPRPSKRSR